MRSIIKGVALAALAVMAGCMKPELKEEALTSDFKPYAISDSSQIKSYPEGLQLYVVEAGPGDYPENGSHVLMHYYGLLDDGTVFDQSYTHPEPFDFTIGSKQVIPGIELAVRKLRMGSKAIAIVPPSLGYGDGKGDQALPPKIPANARLTFHLELIGTF